MSVKVKNYDLELMTGQKSNDKHTDQSPAQVEINGPETKNGIIVNSLSSYVKIRSKPSFESEPIGLLMRDEKVVILERVNEFYKVRADHLIPGRDIYVATEYVKEE